LDILFTVNKIRHSGRMMVSKIIGLFGKMSYFLKKKQEVVFSEKANYDPF